MDVSSYRKKFDEQMERMAEHRERQRVLAEESGPASGGLMGFAAADAGAPVGEDPVEEAMAVVRDRNQDAELRAVTLHSIAIEIGQREDLIHTVLDLLRDSAEPTLLRQAALRVLQALDFSSDIFNTVRPEYMDVLREIINAEDLTLRQQVLEVLAQERDEYAQRRLLEGLQDPSKALVPPEKAIQLLGYDVHAEYFPVLRELVKKPPSAAAKREAVRLLAADPASRDLLADILTDKKQSPEMRRISAISLQALAPEAFEEHARRIVLDDDERDDLRATSLSALANFKGQEALSQDTELSDQVERLQKRSSSKQLGSAAAQFISKKNEESS